MAGVLDPVWLLIHQVKPTIGDLAVAQSAPRRWNYAFKDVGAEAAGNKAGGGGGKKKQQQPKDNSHWTVIRDGKRGKLRMATDREEASRTWHRRSRKFIVNPKD